LLALYNYNSLVAPELSLHNFWFHFTRVFCVFWVCPCSSSAHRALGKEATVPVYKVLARVPFQNRPIHNRPLTTDHSKQTTFVTDLFITDLFITDPFITDHVHNRPRS